MKIYHLLLAYYSAIVSTGLFIWAMFFSTTPDHIMIVILILPISIYFLLIGTGVKETKKADTTENITHTRSNRTQLIILILLSFLFSAVSLRLYMARSLSVESNISRELNSQLKSIQSDVDRFNKMKGSIEKLSIKLDVMQEMLNKDEVNNDDYTLPDVTGTIATPEAITR